MAVLRLEHVSKRYGVGDQTVQAVRDVTLSIDAGEFVAIVGPSGSGKSTLMHLMGLLDVPSTGHVLVDNVEASLLRDRDLARLRNEKIGFVFQNFNLLPRTSAVENVALPLFYAGYRTQPALAKAREALARVGIDPHLRGHHHPNQLSGGQQQRVAIARAIVNEPRVVLADEPTGNLDSQTTDDILDLFTSLNREGTTIVLVTHEEYVARHARRIVSVRDGLIASDEAVVHSAGPQAGVEA
ncbi:ABC transporter ATP-binding protein [Alicyclobacillus shizuokensis]|uniref:ABC transporter ATP-binding protein n=1 Tax=Alicyclobacillus shizuokensis TaxID=392014 RepID=UPI000832DA75|nr:ABC transporter ATP-binding protein [Alicyclobacillus shizuokensis]MCL6625793.1 ABC transporter ATP-binding protein [Alicyclobacillus shizuokensis]